MSTLDEKIEAIKEAARKKIDQLKEQDELIEARKLQALIKGRRSNETRRKILAGALILEMMDSDKETALRFLGRLDKFLTRDDDRALFGLESKTIQPPTSSS